MELELEESDDELELLELEESELDEPSSSATSEHLTVPVGQTPHGSNCQHTLLSCWQGPNVLPQQPVQASASTLGGQVAMPEPAGHSVVPAVYATHVPSFS